jgi:hypothetical protein
MRPAIWIAVALPLLGLPLAACTEGESEQEINQRGLAVPNAVTTPESETDMQETNAQRQQQIEQAEQAVQDKDFDTDNDGKPQPPPPEEEPSY